ncbi:MAG TPA: GIY-YIG nuclease family protein [Alphaproteobacteria bacterium]
MGAYVYILRCRDGAYYVGSTRASLERRVAEHNDGTYGGWTKSRRPVELVFSQYFEHVTDAVAAERQLKGWSRAKKAALIRGDHDELRRLARSRAGGPGATSHPSPSASEPRSLIPKPHPSTSSG